MSNCTGAVHVIDHKIQTIPIAHSFRYRAKIEKIEGANQVKVFYIDYGNVSSP